MRVIVVGSAKERARIRSLLDDLGIEVVGGAPTLAAARAGDDDVDAFLIASIAHMDGRSPDEEVVEALTPREIEVLELLAEGLPNKAIAARLSISDQTVKFHVAGICGKLGAANRTDAVRRAVRRGLIAL
jgi:two-component system, NarL family, nitrate/nitrite response regulator NarL